MKRLRIELATLGSKVVLVMHCNANSRHVGDGMTSQLTTFQGYAFKLNPTIDDIHRQPIEEMDVIKDKSVQKRKRVEVEHVGDEVK